MIVTEWKSFRSPDLEGIRAALKEPVIFDGRNLFDPAAMKAAGFEYFAVGRSLPPADAEPRVTAVESGRYRIRSQLYFLGLAAINLAASLPAVRAPAAALSPLPASRSPARRRCRAGCASSTSAA